jgi:hypothetical protein
MIEKYACGVAQGQDTTVMKLVSYCSSGWPDKHQLTPEVKPYWEHRGKLTVNRGLFLFGIE